MSTADVRAPLRRAPAWLLLALATGSHAESVTLDPVEVTAARIQRPGFVLDDREADDPLRRRRAAGDSAVLLQDIAGMSLATGGGVSSLPVLHGLADDRLRIQVDGLDMIASCPNHMNTPLSYIDPARISSATVYAGVVPVSVGGDSIGGSIQVRAEPPTFAQAGALIRSGRLGGFARSNGQVRGADLSARAATSAWSLAYAGSQVEAGNYRAGGAFKTAGPGTFGGPPLAADVVGSSAYRSENQTIGLAWRSEVGLVQLDLGWQHLPFEGFPNQRMDMTGNDSTQYQLRYAERFRWGRLEASVQRQDVQHLMNMGPDRFSFGADGMPMRTQSRATGLSLQGTIPLGEADDVRIGIEERRYHLYDWWPPVGGAMGPDAFWNIDFGQRNRRAAYAERELLLATDWHALFGLRREMLATTAGPVRGYSSQLLWASDAATFNEGPRSRRDGHWDWTAATRYEVSERLTADFGYARQTRSPSLYERYVWSTQPMATVMNNTAGDGNGYLGQAGLRPEVARTLSVALDGHDAARESWAWRVAAYDTEISDYIDARRCTIGQCGGVANTTARTGFVNLQYANQAARIRGVDLSAHVLLANDGAPGRWTGTGQLAYVHGVNLDSGDHLYRIMPANARLGLSHATQHREYSLETLWVAPKVLVSAVRNEIATAGYGLWNLAVAHNGGGYRVEVGVDNLLNRLYFAPLGGAYVGQGNTMSIRGAPWGVGVPGPGRSVRLTFHSDL